MGASVILTMTVVSVIIVTIVPPGQATTTDVRGPVAMRRTTDATLRWTTAIGVTAKAVSRVVAPAMTRLTTVVGIRAARRIVVATSTKTSIRAPKMGGSWNRAVRVTIETMMSITVAIVVTRAETGSSTKMSILAIAMDASSTAAPAAANRPIAAHLRRLPVPPIAGVFVISNPFNSIQALTVTWNHSTRRMPDPARRCRQALWRATAWWCLPSCRRS